MKVALVYPKLGGQINRAFRFFTGSYDPPLGILYLAGVLREKEIEVNLIDLSFSAHWDEYKNELLKLKPDMVGISSMSPFADQADLAASIAKKCLPECKVVMGGPHPTASPRDTLSNENVDFVVVGEGEKTLPELIEAVEGDKDFSGINGLAYKANGKIRQNPPRGFIQDLDEIPFPARDLLPVWNKYLSQIPFFPYIHPYTTLMGGRGCPFNCSFCQPMLQKMFGRGIRLRSPENVADEVEWLIDKYNIKSVFFFDDTFTANSKWAVKVCDEFIRRKIDLLWGINSHVNTFTHELALKLRKAGCVYVAFGVESGSQRVLKEVLNKGIKLHQVKNAFNICRKAGLLSMASLMIGNPGETREEILETISFVKKIKPDILDAHFTTPTPGSEMYELVKDQLTSQKNRYRPGGLNLSSLTADDLEGLYRNLHVNWQKNMKRRSYYWFGVRRYVSKNLSQGLRFPLKYLFLMTVLVAENLSLVNKISMGLKHFYLRIFSLIFSRSAIEAKEL
jgi:anaerobic magnesium-protoporphyrin IX monomethyl ester cyclase